MPKARTQYVCSNCGAVYSKWYGRCPNCGEFGTLEEVALQPAKAPKGYTISEGSSHPRPITEIPEEGRNRIPVPIEELSRVLGGGLVPGSVVLVGGDPGIGKSTLLLQTASVLAKSGLMVLYASGEESARQMKMRARRLGVEEKALYVLSETHLEAVMSQIESLNPKMVVVDSIQAMFSDSLDNMPGSVTQVRYCASALLRQAKSLEIPMFLVGHVTKEGSIAGPKVLEHMVDTVLYLEGERFHSYRLLRSVKNRFGSTNEVGVFEMQERGLMEVKNPSELFLAERLPNTPGSSIAVTMEGTRPILVEVQALVSPTSFSQPRRTANGVDFNRLLLLAAVLSRRAGIRLGTQDLFVNVVGGMKIGEPAADLAVAMAIASAAKGVSVPADLVSLGEIGLSGELRSVGYVEKRLEEAARLGFTHALLPRSAARKLPPVDGLTFLPARTIREAIGIGLGEH